MDTSYVASFENPDKRPVPTVKFRSSEKRSCSRTFWGCRDAIAISHDGSKILVSSWRKDVAYLLDNEGQLLRTFHASSYVFGPPPYPDVVRHFGQNVAMDCDGTRFLLTLKQGHDEAVVLLSEDGGVIHTYVGPTQFQKSKLKSSPDIGYGASIDLSCDGTRVLIGAEKDNFGYAFLYDDAGRTITTATYPPKNEAFVGTWIGTNVAMNYDGDMILATGGVYNPTNLHVSSGAYIFKDDGATPVMTLHSPLNDQKDYGEVWKVAKCRNELYHPEQYDWHSEFRSSRSTLDFHVDCNAERVFVADSYNSIHLYEPHIQRNRQLQMPFESSATGYDIAISGNGQFGVLRGDYLLGGEDNHEHAREAYYVYNFGPKEDIHDEDMITSTSMKSLRSVTVFQIFFCVMIVVLLLKRQLSTYYWSKTTQRHDNSNSNRNSNINEQHNLTDPMTTMTITTSTSENSFLSMSNELLRQTSLVFQQSASKILQQTGNGHNYNENLLDGPEREVELHFFRSNFSTDR